ncbi:MAG TPA: PHB depolymerase family esterase, partial [Acidobacteriota bacterium]|nr:PHB depolymerase family esterase [Acidobacteriota bacterium]
MTRMGLAILTAALLFLTSAKSPLYSDEEKSIEYAGRIRKYLVHIPPNSDPTTALPLVLVLHGGGGAPEGMARITNFNQKADAEKFIVVYPAGTGRFESRFLTWNSGNCCGYALDDNIDDSGFIRRLIDQLQKELKIDESKIFATGLSNGAMMSYRLGCELSDKIAAIGVVAGAFNYQPCTPAHPVSVIILHGTADQHVLYIGGTPRKQADRHPRTDTAVSDAVAFWTKQDRCSTPPKKEKNGKIFSEVYENCANNSGVTLFSIQDEGHTWPGGEKWAFWADEPSKEISATNEIWKFFANHPKQTAVTGTSKPAVKKPPVPQSKPSDQNQ